MQVKIGDKIYKDTDQPLGIILTAQDRLNILAMAPDRNFYLSYPQNTPPEVVADFMKIQPVKKEEKPEA